MVKIRQRPTLSARLVVALLKTEALQRAPETATRLIRPAPIPNATLHRDVIVDALMQLWDADSTPVFKHDILRTLGTLTGERWFPCPDCGGITGPETSYMCYRQVGCVGVVCPFCGAKCFNEGCFHLVGALGDNDETDRLFVPVRWPHLDIKAPDALDGGDAYEKLRILPKHDRQWMKGVISNFDFESGSIVPALSSATSERGPSAKLQAWCLRTVLDTTQLRHVDHDPPGAGFATGIAPYFFARSMRERSHVVALINKSVARLARCVDLICSADLKLPEGQRRIMRE